VSQSKVIPTEFSGSEMEVVKSADMSPEEFRKKLSDYYMVKFTLNVMDDYH
jgi:hypothetical protein